MPNFSFLGPLEVVVLWLKTTKNSVELEASLAPAEAEVGAVAKADQYSAANNFKTYNTVVTKGGIKRRVNPF